MIHLQEQVLRINGPKAYLARNVPTLGLVIDRFIAEERITDILKQKPGVTTITDGISYSTAAEYRSYIRNYIEPRWSNTPLTAVKALQIGEWLKSLELSPKTRGQVRALIHLLFERAMLWELIDLQRNLLQLVKLRGTTATAHCGRSGRRIPRSFKWLCDRESLRLNQSEWQFEDVGKLWGWRVGQNHVSC